MNQMHLTGEELRSFQDWLQDRRSLLSPSVTAAQVDNAIRGYLGVGTGDSVDQQPATHALLALRSYERWRTSERYQWVEATSDNAASVMHGRHVPVKEHIDAFIADHPDQSVQRAVIEAWVHTQHAGARIFLGDKRREPI